MTWVQEGMGASDLWVLDHGTDCLPSVRVLSVPKSGGAFLQEDTMAFPRKSEDQKMLQHTFRRDRQPKPKTESVLLTAPAWLIGSARDVFQEVAPLLADHGVTSILDGHSLARYSTAEARRREAEGAGHHQQAIRYSKLAEMLGSKLGLNPTDRQRLPVVKPTPKATGVKKLLDRGSARFFTS